MQQYLREVTEWLAMTRAGVELSPAAVGFIIDNWQPSIKFYTDNNLTYKKNEPYKFTKQQQQQIIETNSNGNLDGIDDAHPAVSAVLSLLSDTDYDSFLKSDGIISIIEKTTTYLITELQQVITLQALQHDKPQVALLEMIDSLSKIKESINVIIKGLTRRSQSIKQKLTQQLEDINGLSMISEELLNLTLMHNVERVSALVALLSVKLSDNKIYKKIDEQTWQKLLQHFSSEFYRKSIDNLIYISIKGGLLLTEDLYTEGKYRYLKLALDNLDSQRLTDMIGDAINSAIAETRENIASDISIDLLKLNKNIINVLNNISYVDEEKVILGIIDHYEPLELVEINSINNELNKIKAHHD